MAIACMAMKALKQYTEEHEDEPLTWDQVKSIFNNVDYIVEDRSSAKRINDMKSYDDMNVF